MRQILFRGKRVDNGERVDGSYIYAHKWNWDGSEAHLICNIYGTEKTQIIPKTLGQFIGLYDKNRKKIFTGDIGRYKQTDGARLNGKPIICTGKVIYNEKTASFAVKSKDEMGVGYLDYFPIKDFEIIGNCTDNPELLTAERSDNENQ